MDELKIGFAEAEKNGSFINAKDPKNLRKENGEPLTLEEKERVLNLSKNISLILNDDDEAKQNMEMFYLTLKEEIAKEKSNSSKLSDDREM